MARGRGEQWSGLFCELSCIVLAIFHSFELAIRTASSSPSAEGAGSPALRPRRRSRMSPSAADLAFLFLGVSSALIFGGGVMFVLGFMMMPWVVGILAVLYLFGIVSNLPGLRRAILFFSALSASNDVKSQVFSKPPTDKMSAENAARPVLMPLI